MECVRALLLGDIHLSDRPPSIRTESYADDILDKLRFCTDFANTHAADYLVLLGDVFHVKAPSRTSHRLVLRTAEVLEGFGGRVLIVPGNHDMTNDRLDSLSSQPLGTLALSPRIDLLIGYDAESGIFGIPYLSDWQGSLYRWMDRLGGAMPGGDGTEDDPLNEFAPRPVLLVTHAPIFPEGSTPPYDYISAPDWASLMRWPMPVAYGHIHEQHGLYTVGDLWFCNNGAISRGSLHEETVNRMPKVTLFDTEDTDCPFTTVEVPHRAAADVFRLADHAVATARDQRLDAFLTSIDQVALTSLSLEEVLAQATESGLSDRARAELADILEVALHG